MKYKSPNIGSFKALLPFLIFIAIYLGAGIYFQMQGVDMPFFSRVMPSVDTLIIYALAMVLQGLFLLVWALYNWSRFHGKTRRSSASAGLANRASGLRPSSWL